MTRSKFSVIVLMLIFSIGMLVAQNGERGRGRRDNSSETEPTKKQIAEIVKNLEEELDLTKSQTKEIDKIFTEHFKNKAKNKKPDSDDPEVHRKYMQTEQKKLDDNIKKYLTEEQEKLYEKWKENRRPQRGRGNRQ